MLKNQGPVRPTMCKKEKDSPAAQLKSGFWDAPRRDNQTLEDMVLLLCLLTSRDRTPIGLFQVHFRLLAARVKWDEHQLRSVLKRIEAQGEVNVLENWIFVTTWWDHNSPPGPGWDAHIKEILQEAPAEIIDIWAKASMKAGIKVNRWLNGNTEEPPEPLPVQKDVTNSDPTLGTTPSTTPQSTLAAVDQTTKRQQQSEKPTATTTTTPTASSDEEALELWDPLELSAPAEDYRDLLIEICRAYKLPYPIAREIGWEMSQRLIDSAHDPKSQIYSIRDWLKSVAETAATGKKILSRGYKFRNTLKSESNEVENVAEAIQSKFIEKASERQKAQLIELDRFIKTAPLDAIDRVIKKVQSDRKVCRYAEKISTSFANKETPTGPARIALLKAMRELNFIEV